MRVYILAALTFAVCSPIAVSQTTSAYYKKIYNLQDQKGWQSYALLAPSWGICTWCSPSGSSVNWYRKVPIGSPALSGKAAMHHIGGTHSYADILWNNHIIGDFSSQGIHDYNHTLVPKLHNFVYDVYFYAKNIGYSQGLEFDINQWLSPKGYIWGHECRIAGGHEWDTYDNVHKKWVPTGVPCWPKNNAWNHLVIQVQRTSGGNLLFKSITLNGKTATLNIIRAPGSTSWHGVTVNYQQDGNSKMDDYAIWIDKFNFIYW